MQHRRCCRRRRRGWSRATDEQLLGQPGYNEVAHVKSDVARPTAWQVDERHRLEPRAARLDAAVPCEPTDAQADELRPLEAQRALLKLRTQSRVLEHPLELLTFGWHAEASPLQAQPVHDALAGPNAWLQPLLAHIVTYWLQLTYWPQLRQPAQVQRHGAGRQEPEERSDLLHATESEPALQVVRGDVAAGSLNRRHAYHLHLLVLPL